ncbi:MAG TPA: type II secretion system protein N [Nevskiaceae bacterium]
MKIPAPLAHAVSVRWRWLAPAAVIVFLIAAFTHMPAADAVAWLLPQTSSLRPYGVTGTVSHGQLASLRSGAREITGDLRWTLQPWWLAAGRLAFRVDSSGEPRVRGGIQFTPHTLRAAGLTLDSPLKPLLEDAGYGFAPLDGLLHLHIERATVTGRGVEALAAQASVRSLRWAAGSQPIELGNLQARASMPAAHHVEIRVTTPSGPVDTHGTVSIADSGAYEVDLRFKPRKDASPAALDLLKTMGQPDATGSWRLATRGTLGVVPAPRG